MPAAKPHSDSILEHEFDAISFSSQETQVHVLVLSRHSATHENRGCNPFDPSVTIFP